MMKAYDTAVADFRDAMANLCSGVAVVTTIDGDRPHGTTVSAFMSLSLHPPMVAVALDRGSRLLAHIQHTRRFAVNILGTGQADLGMAFARKSEDKFDGQEWHLRSGLPALDGVAGWLGCYVAALDEAGDHVLVQGGVIDATTASTAPLTYHARTFGTHAPVEA